MSSTVYEMSSSDFQLFERDFQQHVSRNMKFIVDPQSINIDAPLIQKEVKEVSQASNIGEAKEKLNSLASALLTTGKFKEVNFKLTPGIDKRVCSVEVHPVVRKTGFGFWPFEQRGIGLHKANTIKLDAEFFDLTNNYETIRAGRRYNFDTSGDKLFAKIKYQLGRQTSLNFRGSIVNQKLSDKIREEYLKFGCQYAWILDRRSGLNGTCRAGLALKQRNNLMEKWNNPLDVMRTQLLIAKFRSNIQFNPPTELGIELNIGFDQGRQQRFAKVFSQIKGWQSVGPQKFDMLQWSLKGGIIFGQNVSLGEKFNYRAKQQRTSSFLNGKLKWMTLRHSILTGFGLVPFTYLEGWLSKDQKIVKKQLQLGVGFYVKPLGLNVQFGLLDISGRKIGSSSRICVQINNS